MSYAEVGKISRGIERKNIFWNDKDRSDFIDRLAGVVERGAGIYFRTGTSLLLPGG
jgi:hypothetical protein